MKKIFVLCLFFFCLSCKKQNRFQNTSYRLVGKNGDVIYFDKRKPEFNINYLEEQRISKLTKQNNQNSLQQQKDNKVDKDFISYSKEEKDKLMKDSNAYTIRSVMDNLVKNEDINKLSREVDKNSNLSKTIRDFDYIPEAYFEDISNQERMQTGKNLVSSTMSKGNFSKTSTAIAQAYQSKRLESGKYYVQLGVYGKQSQAKKVLTNNPYGNALIVPYYKNNREYYRAILGTFNSVEEAQNTKMNITANGHFDVWVFREK